MNNYRYSLEKGSKKVICPQCRKKTFVRYIDNNTCQPLPENFGKCDRLNKCSHWVCPYKTGYAKEVWEKGRGDDFLRNFIPIHTPLKAKENIKINIPAALFKVPLQCKKNIPFLKYLIEGAPYPYTAQEVKKVAELYHIGGIDINNEIYKAETVRYTKMDGAATFSFVDKNNNVRAIQTKTFNDNNHTVNTCFFHSLLKQKIKGYNEQAAKVDCFFGEHLLNKYPDNPVIIVEAPKSAVYATLYFGHPENSENPLFLAAFSRDAFTAEKCKVLRGRNCAAFADTSRDGSDFEKWKKTAAEVYQRYQIKIKVSDFLEKRATIKDKEEGKDIADYLINLPQPTEPQPTEPQPTEPQPTEPQPTEPQPTEPQTAENRINHPPLTKEKEFITSTHYTVIIEKNHALKLNFKTGLSDAEKVIFYHLEIKRYLRKSYTAHPQNEIKTGLSKGALHMIRGMVTAAKLQAEVI